MRPRLAKKGAGWTAAAPRLARLGAVGAPPELRLAGEEAGGAPPESRAEKGGSCGVLPYPGPRGAEGMTGGLLPELRVRRVEVAGQLGPMGGQMPGPLDLERPGALPG